MTIMGAGFTEKLLHNRVLYVPTCLFIEATTRLYCSLMRINPMERIAGEVEEILDLVEAYRTDVQTARIVYGDERAKFFGEDWREDKQRAKWLFGNLMARLNQFRDHAPEHLRPGFSAEIELLVQEENKLRQTLDSYSEGSACLRSCHSCRCFRCPNPSEWSKSTARTIMEIADEEGGVDAYLIMVCDSRIKTEIARAIENIEARGKAHERFDTGKILCLSMEETPASCPDCARAAETIRPAGITNVAKRREGLPGTNEISVTRLREREMGARKKLGRISLRPRKPTASMPKFSHDKT